MYVTKNVLAPHRLENLSRGSSPEKENNHCLGHFFYEHMGYIQFKAWHPQS